MDILNKFEPVDNITEPIYDKCYKIYKDYFLSLPEEIQLDIILGGKVLCFDYHYNKQNCTFTMCNPHLKEQFTNILK